MSDQLDSLWADFATAYNTPDGYLLATTITPEPPKSDPARLYSWRRWTNAYSVQTDLRYKLQYNPDLRLEKKEASTWLDVFTAYYTFTGKLLAAEEAQNAGELRDVDWSAVYESWKEVLNALYRGYSNNVFAAWTIPCLYVVGKYLRVFAIKTDDNAASQRDSGLAFGALQEEDAFGAANKNEKLEDAARQINRIFALCLSDRYVPAMISPCTAFTRVHTKVSLRAVLRFSRPANGRSTTSPTSSSKPISNSTPSPCRRTFSAVLKRLARICRLSQLSQERTR